MFHWKKISNPHLIWKINIFIFPTKIEKQIWQHDNMVTVDNMIVFFTNSIFH